MLEVLANEIKQEKEIKGIQIWKENMKLLAYVKTVYIENPKQST